MRGTLRKPWVICSVAILFGTLLMTPPGASATPPDCRVSAAHTICVTLPSSTLSGDATIGVRITPNKGVLIVTWLPDAGPVTYLMTRFRPSPGSHDYSFAWPTDKYLDGSGVLRLQSASRAETPVDVRVTLSNGNTTDVAHTPGDWADYLPGGASGPADPWTARRAPVVAAVGDAGADEPEPNTLAETIAATEPPLFLYLGDMYDQGTYTEDLNNFGASDLDDPSIATRWGALATVTQPTVGNHEAGHMPDWTDYWHGRPDYVSFTFGGVRFLDLDSNVSMKVGSPQYQFVQDELANDPPACIVAYWHKPVINDDIPFGNAKAVWALLANNGGDLVLNGHIHNMTRFEPLDAGLLPTESAHMRELIVGSGGHKAAPASTDSQGRIEWSLERTTGFLQLRLVGAARGGAATAIRWKYLDIHGDPIGQAGSFGSVAC